MSLKTLEKLQDEGCFSHFRKKVKKTNAADKDISRAIIDFKEKCRKGSYSNNSRCYNIWKLLKNEVEPSVGEFLKTFHAGVFKQAFEPDGFTYKMKHCPHIMRHWFNALARKLENIGCTGREDKVFCQTIDKLINLEQFLTSKHTKTTSVINLKGDKSKLFRYYIKFSDERFDRTFLNYFQKANDKNREEAKINSGQRYKTWLSNNFDIKSGYVDHLKNSKSKRALKKPHFLNKAYSSTSYTCSHMFFKQWGWLTPEVHFCRLCWRPTQFYTLFSQFKVELKSSKLLQQRLLNREWVKIEIAAEKDRLEELPKYLRSSFKVSGNCTNFLTNSELVQCFLLNEKEKQLYDGSENNLASPNFCFEHDSRMNSYIPSSIYLEKIETCLSQNSKTIQLDRVVVEFALIEKEEVNKHLRKNTQKQILRLEPILSNKAYQRDKPYQEEFSKLLESYFPSIINTLRITPGISERGMVSLYRKRLFDKARTNIHQKSQETSLNSGNISNREKIYKFYKSGMSQVTIAKKLGITQAAVSKCLRPYKQKQQAQIGLNLC